MGIAALLLHALARCAALWRRRPVERLVPADFVDAASVEPPVPDADESGIPGQLRWEPSSDPRVVSLWFASNRVEFRKGAAVSAGAAQIRISLRHAVGLGVIEVRVPDDHRVGAACLSGGDSWYVGEGERLPVPLMLPPETFWQQFMDSLAQRRQRGLTHDVLLYVHGYRNSFEDAAGRAAQLAFDLDVGSVMFFSWPSSGSTEDYLVDHDQACFSHAALVPVIDRLERCAAQAGAKLHLLAHSMGSIVLMNALDAFHAVHAPGSP